MRDGCAEMGNVDVRICHLRLLTGIRPEASDGLSCAPDLLVVDLVELLAEILVVGLSAVELCEGKREL